MLIELNLVPRTSANDTIIVRGRLPDGKTALVRIPWNTDDADVPAVARPLLVVEFARGNWYQIGQSGRLIGTSGEFEFEPQEPVIVQ